MSRVTIDTSRFPVTVVAFEGVVSDEEFQRYLDQLDVLLERREPYVTIVDARATGPAPAIQRKMKADWLARRRPELSRWCLGTAFVIDSPVVRGMLTAILWLSSLPCPNVVVRSRAEAERWVQDRLGASAAAG